MKKLIFAMTVLLVFALSATVMAGGKGPKGKQVTPSAEKIVAQWSGFYTQNAPGGGGTCNATCVGDLVSCTATQGIAFTKVVFTFLAGICDDHDPLATACGGRYTALGEECSELGFPGVISNGPILHVNSRGKNRVCFDDDQTIIGDCTGAPSEGTVIGTGDTRTQTRLDLGAAGGPSHATSESVTRTLVNFIDPADGIVKRLNTVGQRTIAHILAQPNDGANCSGGCGLAGTTVRE